MNDLDIFREILNLLCRFFCAGKAEICIRRSTGNGWRVVLRRHYDFSEVMDPKETVREKAVEQGILFESSVEERLSVSSAESEYRLAHWRYQLPGSWNLFSQNGNRLVMKCDKYEIEIVFGGNYNRIILNSSTAEAAVPCLRILCEILPVIEMEEEGCVGGAVPEVANQQESFEPPYIGCSEQACRLREDVLRVAGSDISVLIEGESGTGKEIIAANIHRFSRRADGPMVKVNCAEIQPSLLRAELFGFKRGSFTGAVSDRTGLVESAAGGTLFLDEIGEMPEDLQAAVLRVIQEKEVRRVGESGSRNVDVRFLFATNRDIDRLVSSGAFRKDLFFRICGVRLKTEPLKKRRKDILPLFLHFLRKRAETEGVSVPRLSVTTYDCILSYGWPGNVRELINETERIIALYRGHEMIREEMLSSRIRDNDNAFHGHDEMTLHEAVERLEKKMITEVLGIYGGNRSKTARKLGISRQGLLNKISRYELEDRKIHSDNSMRSFN